MNDISEKKSQITVKTFDDQEFQVLDTEFPEFFIQEFCNLKLYSDLALYERYTSLINNMCVVLSEYSKPLAGKLTTLSFVGCSHGGYLPIKCSYGYDNVNVYIENEDIQIENLSVNIIKNNIKNINILSGLPSVKSVGNVIVYIRSANRIQQEIHTVPYETLIFNPIIFTQTQLILNTDKRDFTEDYFIYRLSDTNILIYIPNLFKDNFYREFHYYLSESIGPGNTTSESSELLLNYDNLVHLSMIVKNSGPQFEDFLLKNFNNFDRWTILDTGSTDNTIEIINKVLVGKKKGNLYQEPFINFRESRNRALELSGNECKYILILDDTYIIEGEFRKLLESIRSDQFATSYSFFIQSNDNEYTSNRLIKSYRNLRYIYKIHEAIQSKNNERTVILPIYRVKIFDVRSEYMEKRTLDRKKLDLKLLQEMIDEEPDDPRHFHYMAGTYSCIEDYEKCYEYHLKRINHPVEGFYQEKLDSYFEAARTAQYKLNKPWSECYPLYLKAWEMDKTRPDALYFIAIHYLNTNNRKLAFDYFKQAYDLGYPINSQYSLKPTLSFYFLPKLIVDLCYEFDDYLLGQNAAKLFLDHSEDRLCKNVEPFNYKDVMISWYNIFLYLNRMRKTEFPTIPEKKILCFVADGGFSKWTGKDILSKGVGGSETFIIEIARYIKKHTDFDVIVFCNCETEDVFEDVKYLHLSEFFVFMGNVKIHTCFISRFSEYIPVALKGNVDNVYFIAHDLTPSGLVIPMDPKIKQIFCLTEWHVQYFLNIFPTLKNITSVFNYGIDNNLFSPILESNKQIKKEKFRFIYSSFPNRGLLPLLQMWPKIIKKIPEATLNIHSDINGKWVNEVCQEQMKEIKKLLENYLVNPSISNTINYYGWTDKKTLAESWLSSEVWFYPCIFKETFCLTALEAALTKTFVVTTDLAALKNTVDNRGVLIPIESLDDVLTEKWQDNALEILFQSIYNKELKDKLIEKNYEWSLKMSWENQAVSFLDNFMDDK